MKKILLVTTLLGAALVSCAPGQTTVTNRVENAPVVFKISPSAARGESFALQGRYLGGIQNGQVRVGSYIFPADSIVRWSNNEIVINVPANAPVGGNDLIVSVGGTPSLAVPFSIH